MSHIRLHPQSSVNAATNATKRWASSLGIWGASLGAFGVLALSVTPLFRREVLQKVPVLGSYYEDKTPASDKPF
ncbi:ubiquinol-cytochrome-c reductase complex subunit-domain-containing protein [Crepidotus variabilis]|uniref:Ubiquinol-cytochrome-c reductase complex subunit-domain-containing protein n=1 Tax=Crepidotus variabilis TaxID=179855 RepID=A0A9P6ENN4_9AGAR|nr:ubiquinol-cytochrome-c reductase complex subunit-domain-containing protein [Crepidotus variabilis]